MLDMGFLPDIKRVLRHIPAKRQNLLFSATMPGPIAELSRDILHAPAMINLERKSAPAVGITQAVYPVAQELKSQLLLELLSRGEIKSVIAFTRTKHRANRLADFLKKHGVAVRADPRQPLAGAADRGARGLQERQVPRPRRDRHRRARHRRRGALARRQLRRPARPGRLHPPRRPDGPRRGDGRRLHVRRPRRGGRPLRHRARRRQAPPPRHAPRLRLHEAAAGAARDPDRRADRPDPRPEGRRAGPREGEGRAPRPDRGRDEGPHRREGPPPGGRAGPPARRARRGPSVRPAGAPAAGPSRRPQGPPPPPRRHG